MSTYVITINWSRPNLQTPWFREPGMAFEQGQELVAIANLSSSDSSGLTLQNVWTFDSAVKQQWLDILTKYSTFIADEKTYRASNGITRTVVTELDGTVVPNF